MKINIEPLLIVYLCFMVLVGCDKNNPIPVPVDTVDKITILSVTPNNGLTDGQPTDFSVMVSYNLYKRQTGTLMIGFNNSPSTGAFVMLPDADKIVNKGSGQHTFNVTATIKDWAHKPTLWSMSIYRRIPYPSIRPGYLFPAIV